HVIDARIVGVLHLGEPEIGALARMAGHDVVDDRAAIPICRPTHLSELVFGAEGRVDLCGDPVKVAVDTRRQLPSRDTARALYRSGVDRLDANLGERLPHLLVGQGLEERLIGTGDQRQWIGGEPDRRGFDGTSRTGRGIRVLPHRALTGELRAYY